ncbi:NADPH-dependent F420 reductase [Streptomyces arenae]|uniref:NADPH-dependent F420 reductase n=1 Tax=Streptomyces arenae TaxID=29301 RepID=UPI002659FBFB|nr:NADPH-dependent F420 reductase [Streptomyces arenae]MCG7206552.1 NADPH-dependent F420 reductase [Streptomyces arenae]
MPQTLGLIGSGAIGSTLARLAVAAGIDVVLSNSRGPESLADLVAELGPRAGAATPEQAARAGDLVVVTIPLIAYDRLPADALAGKTVLDTMNYYPQRDGLMDEFESDRITSSTLVQQHLAGATVVKAFNNIAAHQLGTLARPAGAPDRSALPVAGNDAQAKRDAARLIDRLGFDTVDIGTLEDSWRSEPTTPVYVAPYQGTPPTGLGEAERFHWGLQAPGVPVPAATVLELVGMAERGPVRAGIVPGV